MNTVESTPVAFVDTETTGLDPERHEIWEVALIVEDKERSWFLPVDLGRADAVALRIGGFHERYPSNAKNVQTDLATFARDFARLTRGKHLCGAVISFDEERLRKLLRANGACPEWHYHLVDVEALAAGYIAGTITMAKDTLDLPWQSEELSRIVGVDPDQFDRHTALGDARWAQAIYNAVVGESVS